MPTLTCFECGGAVSIKRLPRGSLCSKVLCGYCKKAKRLSIPKGDKKIVSDILHYSSRE